jgi:hypothetical protein
LIATTARRLKPRSRATELGDCTTSRKCGTSRRGLLLGVGGGTLHRRSTRSVVRAK